MTAAPRVTPFKSILENLVRNSRHLESVSIGVDKSLVGISYDDAEDESDDLYLTDVEFVKNWLPSVCEELKFLSISDCWFQSCWRKSEVLAFISSCCKSLVELEVKNAWLSVDNLNQMPMLTKLTLEFIRLEDEDLDKVNDCFPCLQVLNLVGVGGFRQPKIHLLHLKSCLWTVSNAPLSLAIDAPNLVKLELRCVKPKSLVLETPLLHDFCLSLEVANEIRFQEFRNLMNLQLESSSLSSLINTFPFGKTIKKLKVELLKPVQSNFDKGRLEIRTEMKVLKEIIARLVVDDISVTRSFIFAIMNICSNLSDMALLIHREEDSITASNLISSCTVDHPRVRWRWGMWKEGTEDTWVTDGI